MHRNPWYEQLPRQCEYLGNQVAIGGNTMITPIRMSTQAMKGMAAS